MNYGRSDLIWDIFILVLSIVIVAVWPLWFNWIGVGISIGATLSKISIALQHRRVESSHG